MILNSRNNLFNFKFPRKFIPEEVAEKYRNYLNRVPGNLLTEPIDFINYSVQGIGIPGLSLIQLNNLQTMEQQHIIEEQYLFKTQ
jgi:hypothetical protein